MQIHHTMVFERVWTVECIEKLLNKQWWNGPSQCRRWNCLPMCWNTFSMRWNWIPATKTTNCALDRRFFGFHSRMRAKSTTISFIYLLKRENILKPSDCSFRCTEHFKIDATDEINLVYKKSASFSTFHSVDCPFRVLGAPTQWFSKRCAHGRHFGHRTHANDDAREQRNQSKHTTRESRTNIVFILNKGQIKSI